MKAIATVFTVILLGTVLNVTAASKSPQNSATIQINSKQIVIPLKHQNHWIHITEKSDGKSGHVVVQSQDGKHGKIVTKRFKIDNKHPNNNTYNVIEYSGSHRLNKQQTKEMLHYLQQQQAFMQRLFMQQQHEMQTQLAATNHELAALQHQFAQMKMTPPAPMKKVH